MRVLIVEDEAPARERLRQLASEHDGIEIIGEAVTGPDAVRAIESLAPDLVLLDVALPQMDGFEVLACLDITPLPLVIFTTAFDAHAIRAFESEAVDYLLKPIERERFADALRRAREKVALRRGSDAALRRITGNTTITTGRIVVRHKDRIVFVKPEEIDAIESAGNYVAVHCRGERFLLRQTLAAAEERLQANGFVRIQRSVLVNAERIAELRHAARDTYVVILAGGLKYRLSPNYRANLERAMGRF